METETQAESEVPAWMTDLVVTQLRRSYPEPVSKEALQEQCGMGAGDLRMTLAALEEEGTIAAEGDGYSYVEGGAAIGQRPDEAAAAGEGDAPPDALLGEGEAPAAVEPEPESARQPDAKTGDTRYQVIIAVEVGFYPELEEGETDDEAAVRESEAIMGAAAAGISEAFPELPVGLRVAALDAFDSPRRVYPPANASDS